ncbi:MAG: UDP-glucose 4-epimerase [Chloroflexi bacterium ADurb.Bin120]|jgi:UDP-glucose 4-epimerase|uniref:UDP-glucose 4-epimerase n=1 Tax=Candidatus Brevifilum fermentans TaxID=1986204 RepID=A0A1Y6K0R4_9CHLR|nr:UDP-glucose 4-epimerase GalE [Brevefilum fermentans]MDI9566823.1 UDP-glucose 4-epimerase GalE [Chloroflexota bacterium]OQB87038.1 MAG: UDP-glucose 4-epimerase [Chloroflexi bacterium ADurb.Bin120]SMX53275.1 UDP-glucose 4-epimerase [Brevefilum fermentans]HOM66871.1 UDP-glucose 4-epimerase GalE [Brevefilum fermentans]
MKVLITGGAGYIGSTICSALLDHGHTPVILDSLVTGQLAFTRGRIFYHGDIADQDLVRQVFKDHPDITATIHCAALIVVPESVSKPYEYYQENVVKSMDFFFQLATLGYPRVVFSSSAAIYDVVPGFMVTESSPLNPISPYSRTKYMMEMILKDFCHAYGLKGIALRYFNPIGADPHMRTGLHIKEPSHILGRLVAVARGEAPEFQITGTDWPTRDGTGIRDYIHVWNLALAHIKAVERFDAVIEADASLENPYAVINLGTGRGVTVREMVKAFEHVLGREIPKVEMPPRPGDVAGSYANADKALSLLGWSAEQSIEAGIADALKWGEIRDQILGW